MTEEKRKRIIVAITVGVVILVFVLIAVVIAQLVQISVLNRRKKELQQQLTAYFATYKTLDDWQADIKEDEEAYAWFLEFIDLVGEDHFEEYLPILSEGKN